MHTKDIAFATRTSPVLISDFCPWIFFICFVYFSILIYFILYYCMINKVFLSQTEKLKLKHLIFLDCRYR